MLGYVAAGAVLGIGGAILIAGNLRSLLVGVSPRDPLTVAAAVTVMGAVAVAGALAPLLKAVRTDPAEVLDSA
jgi:ABC-type antimicrobial peptide transport system permease subunit